MLRSSYHHRMWLRRIFHRWLLPAAFLLPLWLVVGWSFSDRSGWAFLWVILLAVPSVFLGQLVLTLLVRARGTVRAERAVSWLDVGGFALWHALVVSLGFYDSAWWSVAMVLAVVTGLALFWTELWQLWRQAKPIGRGFTTGGSISFGAFRAAPAPTDPDVVVLEERGDRPGR